MRLYNYSIVIAAIIFLLESTSAFSQQGSTVTKSDTTEVVSGNAPSSTDETTRDHTGLWDPEAEITPITNEQKMESLLKNLDKEQESDVKKDKTEIPPKSNLFSSKTFEKIVGILLLYFIATYILNYRDSLRKKKTQ